MTKGYNLYAVRVIVRFKNEVTHLHTYPDFPRNSILATQIIILYDAKLLIIRQKFEILRGGLRSGRARPYIFHG